MYFRVLVAASALVLFLAGAACPLIAEAEEPARCVLCGNAHTSEEHSVLYKGHRIPLCSPPCQAKFRELERTGGLDPVTAGIEPRAALFQSDSAPRRTDRFPFFAGVYVLFGLLTGGGAAFAAVHKGRPAGGAFALGFALSIVGLAIVLAQPARETRFHASGLRKVPTTRTSMKCPACGRPNHPAAAQCLHCGRALEPASRSEVNPG